MPHHASISLNCANCTCRLENIFRELRSEEVADLSARKTCYHYRKGDTIFSEGGHSVGLYCLSKGKVKVFKTGMEGREQIVRLAKTGDILGYRALVSREPYYATAVALEECTICLIPTQEFFRFVSKNPAFSMGLVKLLSHDLREAEERMVTMAQKSVRERLAGTLLILHDTYGFIQGEDRVLDVNLSREELASMVGTATETVIRLLSDFREEGIVETPGKKIRILNLNVLKALAT